jgi:hypothetical protein
MMLVMGYWRLVFSDWFLVISDSFRSGRAYLTLRNRLKASIRFSSPPVETGRL